MGSGIWLISAVMFLVAAGAGWLFFSRARRFADQRMDSIASGPITPPAGLVGETSRRIEAGINKTGGVIFMVVGTGGFVLCLLYFFGVLTPPSA